MSDMQHINCYTHVGLFEKGRVVKMCSEAAFDILLGALPKAFGLSRDIYETKTIGRICCLR